MIITYTIADDKSITVSTDYTSTVGENLTTTLNAAYPSDYSIANGWAHYVAFSLNKQVTMSDLTLTNAPMVSLPDDTYQVPNSLLCAGVISLQFTAQKMIDDVLNVFESVVKLYPRIQTSINPVGGVVPPLAGAYVTEEIVTNTMDGIMTTHISGGDHDGRYYTKTQSDEAYATNGQVQSLVLGEIPENSILNVELSTDCRVGSLALLPTTTKVDVVSAIVEHLANLSAHEATDTPTAGHIPLYDTSGNIVATGLKIGSNVSVGLFASGTYSDTTTSILASSNYVKTIPLGFAAKKGRMILRGTGANFGCIVYFDTTNTHSMSIQTSTVSILNKTVDGALTTVHPFGGAYIDLLDVVITGSNLVITFKNTDTSAHVLSVAASFWEVEG